MLIVRDDDEEGDEGPMASGAGRTSCSPNELVVRFWPSGIKAPSPAKARTPEPAKVGMCCGANAGGIYFLCEL